MEGARLSPGGDRLPGRGFDPLDNSLRTKWVGLLKSWKEIGTLWAASHAVDTASTDRACIAMAPCRARESVTENSRASLATASTVAARKSGMLTSSAPITITESICCPLPHVRYGGESQAPRSVWRYRLCGFWT